MKNLQNLVGLLATQRNSLQKQLKDYNVIVVESYYFESQT